MKKNENKIFVISVHKTGTTTLKRSLEIFGYKVTGPDTNLIDEARNFNWVNIYDYLKKYDAFQDDPWFVIYKELFELYPRGKFILLERDEDEWIKSVQNFYGNSNKAGKIRKFFYGSKNPFKNEKAYLDKFRAHNQEVKDFFKGHPNFLVLNVGKEGEFNRLKAFLGINSSRLETFPVVNKTPKNTRQRKIRKLKQQFLSLFGLNYLIKRLVYICWGEKALWSLKENVRYYKTWLKTRFFYFLR